MVKYREIADNIGRDRISKLMKSYFKTGEDYTIDSQNRVTIHGECEMTGKIAKIPVTFAKTGNFSCDDVGIVSLLGAPVFVDGNFMCQNNRITSLKGGPNKIGPTGMYNCASNKNLTSLEGCPNVLHCLNALDCSLTTLVGCPSQCSLVQVSDNKLTSLEGAPQSTNEFYCSNNQLTSLQGCAKNVLTLDCRDNPFDSLDGFPEHITFLFISPSPDLPLLRTLTVKDRIWCYKGKKFDDHLSGILNKYNGRNYSRASIVACQKELIDAGYAGNAAW